MLKVGSDVILVSSTGTGVGEVIDATGVGIGVNSSSLSDAVGAIILRI